MLFENIINILNKIYCNFKLYIRKNPKYSFDGKYWIQNIILKKYLKSFK